MLKCIILVALNYLQKTERLVDKVCKNKYFILFWTYMHICLFNRYTTEPASGQRQHRLIQIESIVFINWGSKMSTYNDSANIHMVFFFRHYDNHELYQYTILVWGVSLCTIHFIFMWADGNVFNIYKWNGI